MINKEYGKYYGICDICGDETDKFDDWQECRDNMQDNGWSLKYDSEINEWEHICAECREQNNE